MPEAETFEPLDVTALLADLGAWWDNPNTTPFFSPGTKKTCITGSVWDQNVAEGTQNPYWEIVRRLPIEDLGMWGSAPQPSPASYVMDMTKTPAHMVVDRQKLCRAFSWSIPSPGDIAWMREILDGRGVVECGAGGGYWAWQLEQAGVDVVAYDVAETGENSWASTKAWHPVLRAGHEAAMLYLDRALFLCWPSYSDPWAAHSLAVYKGDMLFFAGEGPGGCTADDEFFELLEAEWEMISESNSHVSYSGIHCYLTAYKRKEG